MPGGAVRRFVTTRPDPAATRPADLVERDFTAARPNQLWVVDFTYVATWSGMAFTAFGSDALEEFVRQGTVDPQTVRWRDGHVVA